MGEPTTVLIWRALLQLSQGVRNVLESQIPARFRIPAEALGVLRLLRWHGPKTTLAIATFSGTSVELSADLLRRLHEARLIRETQTEFNVSRTDALAWMIAPDGIAALRKVAEAQREHVESVIQRALPAAVTPAQLAELVERLAFEMVASSTGAARQCVTCAAFDPGECLRPGAADEHCALRQAGFMQFDPLLPLNPNYVPGAQQ